MSLEFWFLIGAALVFWMQAGFAMVETGFTRAKNAGNIIMKNLMDFCIGSLAFLLLGYSLMLGENVLGGLVGMPGLSHFYDFKGFIAAPSDGSFTPASLFIFNLVFCATTSTIVSGAVAERTKFSAYCLYSVVISMLIYPIEAHWIWGGGWLAGFGFHDYAGSCAIHMVGGIGALAGAVVLGPRIGKYIRDDAGRVAKVNAIPGHSITLGALGVFILWFGWYGFNGAAAASAAELSSIFVTTTICPAAATTTAMLFTWLKNGKPDVSMTLNASLAGLVGVTAGCDAFDAAGAAAVGIICGFAVVLAVEVIDLKFHVDDPVGAVSVHGACGIIGTLAVGIFASPDAPAGIDGLLYTGSAAQLKVQIIGMASVAAYAAAAMFATFFVIRNTVGMRASAEDELHGLDSAEHGLPAAYADFAPAVEKISFAVPGSGVPVPQDEVPVFRADERMAAPAASVPAAGAVPHPKFTKIQIICRREKLNDLKEGLSFIGITGMTVSHVLGCGMQKGRRDYYRGVPVETNLIPKVKVDIVVSKIPVRTVIEAAKKILYTGNIGDGKIFVSDIENAVKIRTGQEGYDALQDVE